MLHATVVLEGPMVPIYPCLLSPLYMSQPTHFKLLN